MIGQYLKKGNPLFVEGRLKLDQWDDKNTGQKVTKLRVVMENFQFVGGNRGADGGGPGPGSGAPSAPPPRQARPAPTAAPSAPEGGDGPTGEVDDVPF